MRIKNIALGVLYIIGGIIIYPLPAEALDNRGCPTNYAELQSVQGHKELLAEVARERGYSAVPDAGKVDSNADSALKQMQDAAKAANVSEISVASGYRSYNDQVSTFFARSGVTNPITTCYTGVSNREEAKRQYIARGEASAPPGFSEHHSGKAFDFSPISQSFENTTAFTWLQSNASKYGFKLSYPKGSTQGAGYEPWHWYYIGGGVNETPVGDNNQTGNSATGNTTSPTTTAGTVSYQSYTNFPGVGRISSLCQLMNALWLLGFAVLLTSVLGMFLWGGYIYVTAGVNAGKVNQAKEIFTNTITGLIIGLSIFIIINVINPGLLQGNCSIPPIGSTGTGAGQPTFGGPVTSGPTASVVEVGRFIESRMGLRVREHSAWNGGRPITGGHSIGSLHYQDNALDITDWRRPGEPQSVWLPRMQALDRAWSPIARKYGIQFFGPITDPAGHPTHIHLGFPNGNVSSAALDEMLTAERQVLQQYPLR
jgi:LAS superfamily LD-carboxypeptidase LdcB